jgi:hypothetical protein
MIKEKRKKHLKEERNTYGRGERGAQGVGGETLGKEAVGETQT